MAELDNCHENATCTNTFGSFECACNSGFDGDGVSCTSKASYIVMVEEKLNNVVFSTADPSISVCFVVSEQHSTFCCCSRCHNSCHLILSIDINECELERHNCHMYADCTDTIGSFECTCNSGFEGDGMHCGSMS